jgi:uncharacterized protein
MVGHLPELIGPLALVDKRRRLTGALPLSMMASLNDLLFGNAGEAFVDLRFEKDGRVSAVLGRIKADFELQCQCCLSPIPWHVDSEIRLGIVGSIEEANLLPDDFEPLLLDEEFIPLTRIVQEELILAIPQIPQHASCKLPGADKAERVEPSDGPQRQKPFADLANFK